LHESVTFGPGFSYILIQQRYAGRIQYLSGLKLPVTKTTAMPFAKPLPINGLQKAAQIKLFENEHLLNGYDAMT
jgi:hypothetical protein